MTKVIFWLCAVFLVAGGSLLAYQQISRANSEPSISASIQRSSTTAIGTDTATKTVSPTRREATARTKTTIGRGPEASADRSDPFAATLAIEGDANDDMDVMKQITNQFEDMSNLMRGCFEELWRAKPKMREQKGAATLRIELVNDPTFGGIVAGSEYLERFDVFTADSPSISDVGFAECVRQTAFAWELGEAIADGRDQVSFRISMSYDPGEERAQANQAARECFRRFNLEGGPTLGDEVRRNPELRKCLDGAFSWNKPRDVELDLAPEQEAAVGECIAGLKRRQDGPGTDKEFERCLKHAGVDHRAIVVGESPDEKALSACIDDFRRRHAGATGKVAVDDALRECAKQAGAKASYFEPGVMVEMH